jgi:AsmA protein
MTAPTPSPPRRRRRWRWALLGILLLLLLPPAGVAVLLLSIDLEAQKPRIEAAVREATGRSFAIGGPIGVKFSLIPTLTLRDLSLGNPAGEFSRPEMLALRHVEAELALLPLLSRRVELRSLRVEGLDLRLERAADGTANWLFKGGSAAVPPEPAGSAEPPPAAQPGFEVAVGQVQIEQAILDWRGGPPMQPLALTIQTLQAKPQDLGRRVGLSGDFALHGLPLTLAGEIGPFASLLVQGSPPEPWPVRLTLDGEGGARLRIEGALADPARGRGYRLALAAAAPDPAPLAALLPGVALPPVRELEAAATLTDADGAPEVSNLRVAIGQVPLGSLQHMRVEATLARLDAPIILAAEARADTLTGTLIGTIEPANSLVRTGEARPVTVDLRAALGQASATIAGRITDPLGLQGADLALAVNLPELIALGPLAPGATMPPIRDIVLEAKVAGLSSGLAGGVALSDLRVASSAGDLAGTLSVGFGERPSVAGRLTSSQLDLDAMSVATDAVTPPVPAMPSVPAPSGLDPSPADGRLIPDLPLPLGALRLADGDLSVEIGSLVAAGREWRSVSGQAVLVDGRGRLDRFAATLAGIGRIGLHGTADATAAPPAAEIAVHAEGLDLAGLVAAFGRPSQASGRIGADILLRGHGQNLRDFAAHASGHLGLTLTAGTVPVPEQAFANLRQRIPGIGQLPAVPIEIGCAAARFEVQDGVARSQAIVAETSLGRLGAGPEGGTISLRDERLALRLAADLRLPLPALGPAGLRLRAPIPLTGTLAAPRPEWSAVAGSALAGEAANRAEQALGPLAGQLLGALGGAVAGGGGREQPGGNIPPCAPTLAAAMGGGPAPAAGATPAPVLPAPAQRLAPTGPTQELLRRLGPLPGLLGR